MRGRPRTGVFLSYARKDEALATQLRERLRSASIEVQQDRTILEGGIGWWNQITDALDQVEFMVLLMSASVIDSETVRREWGYAREQGVCVYPVKAPNETFHPELLPRWMRKAHFYDLDKEWEKLVRHLQNPCQALRVPFMVPDLPHPFVQRSVEFEALRQRLLGPDREPAAIKTSLTGAGGFGKTTLAAAVCHDPDVINAFDDGVLWVTLGEKPQLHTAIRTLYSALTDDDAVFADERDGAYRLWQKVGERNCLLVIDDVWDATHLQLFLERGPCCSRLITTRRFDLTVEAKGVHVDEMTPEEAVQLLTAGLDVVDDRYRQLVHQLGEWPLLVELARGTLREEMARGAGVDQALAYLSEALKEEGAAGFDRLRASVEVSLRHLEPDDGERYTHLAIFPEDASIPTAVVRALWGLGEFKTQQLLRRLDNLSLLKLDVRTETIALHDVMRTYLAGKLTRPAELHGRLVDAWGDPQQLPNTYAWNRIAYHLLAGGRKPDLRRMLLDLEWLSQKLQATGINELIADFEYLKGDPDTDLVQSALRLSAHVLKLDKTQLAAQLSGRLLSSESPDIASMLRTTIGRGPGKVWLRPLATDLVTPGGGLLRTIQGHVGVVHGVALTAEGHAISASGDGTVRLWDLESGEELRCFQNRGKAVKSLALTTDGRALAGSEDCTVKVWDLKSGALLNSVGGFPHWIEAIGVSNNQRVACGCFDGSLVIWDLKSLTGLPVIRAHKDRIYAIATTGDGTAISASGDGTLKLWNLETGAEVRSLIGHRAAVASVAIFDNGRKAISGAADDTVKVWNLVTGEEICSLTTPGWVLDIAVLGDGRRALLVSNDHMVRIVDCEAATEICCFEGHVESVLSVAVTPDGRRAVSASVDQTIRVWDLESETAPLPSPRHTRLVTCSAVTTGGRHAVSASADGTVKVWDLSSGAELGSLVGHTGCVRALATIGNDRVISASEDRTIKLWDLQNRSDLATAHHSHWVTGIAVTPDGRTAVSVSFDKTMNIWGLQNGIELQRSVNLGQFLTAVAVAEDGSVAVCADTRGVLVVWDLHKGEFIRSLRHHTSVLDFEVSAVGIACDGQTALSASHDHTVIVWDLASGTIRYTYLGHKDRVYALAVTEAGRVVSASEDRTLRLWDLATGKDITVFTTDGRCTSCSASKDGRTIAAGDSLGHVHFFCIEEGEETTATGR